LDGTPRSHPNVLERIAAHLPGIAGYRDREARRETDRRLREHLARRLDDAAASFDRLRLALTDASRLDRLDEVGRLDRRVRGASHALRHAAAGYSGLFDAVKVREAELDALLAHDAGLVEEVEAFAVAAETAAGTPVTDDTLSRLSAHADALAGAVARRQELLERPATSE
jgi:hypothetical protein